MTLSFEKSPRPWGGSAARLLDPEPKDWTDVPATAQDLIQIRLLLRETAGIRYGRFEHLVGHVLPQRLASIDHLIAVHVLGYEFRPQGRRRGNDWCGNLAWKTGLGTYTADATSPWTTNTDVACGLVNRYLPLLRVDIRFGGAQHGQVREARFDERHPTLAGEAVLLPAEWPYGVSKYPAIAVVDTLLTALAMQKEAAVQACPESATEMIRISEQA